MKKVLLVILDGIGWRTETKGNAFHQAHAPTIKDLFLNHPNTLLWTHGSHVGLPDGIMGNSEVGHMTIGAGRIYAQDLSRINDEIKNKTFDKNPVLLETIKKGNRVHLIGLVSDGGVHSHLTHLQELIKLCEKNQKEFFVHALLDGRDTSPGSCFKYLKNISSTQIGSVCGRYFGMDRDQRWERTQKFYDTVFDPKTSVEKKIH